jgi:hypothetical protein
MNQNLFHTLMQFHREIVSPEMQRLIDKQTAVMNSHFDHVDLLFDRALARLDRIHSIAASIPAERLEIVNARIATLETSH